MKSWFKKILDYFAFVNERRLTASGEIIPNKFYLLVGLVFVIAAVVMAFFLLDQTFSRNYFNQYPTVKFLMEWTTNIGKADWMLAITGSVLLFMSLQQPSLLSRAQHLRWHHRFLRVYFVFSTIVFSGLIVLFFKNAIGRARPKILDSDAIWVSVPFGHPYDYASFPSGHSTTIAALAMAIALLFPKLRYLMLALAIWIGSSRAVVGVHYPSDILAGLSLGALFTWIYARLFAKRRLLFEFTPNNKLRLRSMIGDNQQVSQYMALDAGNNDPNSIAKRKLKASSNP